MIMEGVQRCAITLREVTTVTVIWMGMKLFTAMSLVRVSKISDTLYVHAYMRIHTYFQ